MFGMFNKQPQGQQQQQSPQNHPSANMPNNPGNGGQGGGAPANQPAGNNTPNPQSNEPVNPLDTYSKMFDNPTTTGDNPPAFQIDPKVMDEVVGGQDFTKGIDSAVMQKAMQGDAQSMIDIMQAVGRNSYRSAIEHGGMLTDKFVGAREQHGSKSLGSKVRQELTAHALSTTPNFQHPVVKKQLTEVAQRLQQQHPDALPQEIADKAKEYITALASALNPQDPNKQPAGGNSEERGEDYWNNFFSE